MTDAADARTALQAAHAARAHLAGRLRCPAYMHAVFGALMGGLVASEAASDRGTLVIEGLIAVAAVIVFVVNRRRMGFFVNGYRKGRTRPIALAMVGVYLVLFSLAAYFKSQGLHWPALALGGLTFGLATWGSMAWQNAYQAELNAEVAPR